MTIKEIENYAKEKKVPKRGLDDMIKNLRAQYGEEIDDMTALLICSYIDGWAEHCGMVRNFLENRRKERKEKK